MRLRLFRASIFTWSDSGYAQREIGMWDGQWQAAGSSKRSLALTTVLGSVQVAIDVGPRRPSLIILTALIACFL